MKRLLELLGAWRRLTLLCMATLLACAAHADPIPIGYLSWDVVQPGAFGEFDLVNQSGANASGDTTWPVDTALMLSDLALTVTYSNGTSTAFGSAYFTLSADGLSFDGGLIPIGQGMLPVQALLTGLLGPTSVALYDGSNASLQPSFSAAIAYRADGLVDGDFGLVDASSAMTAPVPEPGSFALMSVGLIALASAMLRRRRAAPRSRAPRRRSAWMATLAVGSTMLALPAFAAVKLNAWTAPSNGTAGSDYVNLTVSGIALAPAAQLTGATVTLSPACGGPVAATVAAASVKLVVGTSWRIQFGLPDTLATGTYAVAVTATGSDGSTQSGANCAQVAVTGSPTGGWTTLVGRGWSLPASISSGVEAFVCSTFQATADMYISAFHAITPDHEDERMLTITRPLDAQPIGDHDCAPTARWSADRAGYMGSPGSNDVEFPAGNAFHIHAGDIVTLWLHISNPTSQPISGQSTLQVRTLPAASVTREVELRMAGKFNFKIPANRPDYLIEGVCFPQAPFDMVALAPHTHRLGRRVTVSFRHANEPYRTLLDSTSVFPAQITTPLASPIHADVDDAMTVDCRYNATSEPNQTSGEYNEDEQCLVGVYRTVTPAVAGFTFSSCPIINTW